MEYFNVTYLPTGGSHTHIRHKVCVASLGPATYWLEEKSFYNKRFVTYVNEVNSVEKNFILKLPPNQSTSDEYNRIDC